MQSELSPIRKQLVSEFLPDDACSLGAQLFMDAPQKLYQVDLSNREAIKEVISLYSFQFSSLLFFPLFFVGREYPMSCV